MNGTKMYNGEWGRASGAPVLIYIRMIDRQQGLLFSQIV